MRKARPRLQTRASGKQSIAQVIGTLAQTAIKQELPLTKAIRRICDKLKFTPQLAVHSPPRKVVTALVRQHYERAGRLKSKAQKKEIRSILHNPVVSNLSTDVK